jgi:hypothetical protein
VGRFIGIVFIVLAIWIGLEFYTKGSEGACGGIFAGALDPVSDYQASPDGRSPTQRIEDRVRSDIERGFQRTDSKVR